jgi:protein-S-isoprenylcysteine O-methyltransferase Ste14
MDDAWGGLRAQLARRRVSLGFLAAVAAVVLAQPTWTSWALGLLVASAGEAIRVWAAGHIEKGREVTMSGPYQWMRHPLYVGSSVMALGVMLAARSLVLAVVATIYMVATIGAAVGSEEAHLRQKFGAAYDRYARAEGLSTQRAFSLKRAIRNREYRAACGLAAGFLILALKVAFNL